MITVTEIKQPDMKNQYSYDNVGNLISFINAKTPYIILVNCDFEISDHLFKTDSLLNSINSVNNDFFQFKILDFFFLFFLKTCRCQAK